MRLIEKWNQLLVCAYIPRQATQSALPDIYIEGEIEGGGGGGEIDTKVSACSADEFIYPYIYTQIKI